MELSFKPSFLDARARDRSHFNSCLCLACSQGRFSDSHPEFFGSYWAKVSVPLSAPLRGALGQMKIWLAECDSQELCGWPGKWVELVVEGGSLLKNLLFIGFCSVVWFQNL